MKRAALRSSKSTRTRVALPSAVAAPVPPAPVDESLTRDSYAATAFADIVDRSMHATTARFTAGLSPIAFADAYLDWASHLAFLPGKRIRLAEKAAEEDRCASATTRLAAPGTTRSRASTRCRRTTASTIPRGSSGRSTCLPVVPADAAVVAQRDDRRARRHPAAREHGGVRDAADARRVCRRPTSSRPIRRCCSATHERGRHEPRARRSQLPRGLRARGERQAADRRRRVRARPRRRGHARQGRVPQPADRAHPVRADDRAGAARADPDRAGVDHEVLHPRPVAGRTRSSSTWSARASRCS